MGGAEVEGFGRRVVLVHGAGIGPGKLAGPSHDGLEHRVQIECGAERSADLAKCPKLAYRARQLGRPRSQFVEQAHVLDRDHRLVSEGLEQRDLLGRERLDLGPPIDHDDAQRRALAQERRCDHCPGEDPGLPHAGHGFRELCLRRHDVLDLDRPPVAHSPSADTVAADRDGVSDCH